MSTQWRPASLHVILTGGAGMLGHAVTREWNIARPEDTITVLTRRDVDLRDKSAVSVLIADLSPDAIIHVAAKVGGIGAKIAEPTPFLLDNLLMDSSVISAAIDVEVPELLYIGSAAVYPELYTDPFVEADMLTGALEKANEGYAIAKIAGSRLCQYASRQFGVRYRTALPSNLYGPDDHFDLESAHLVSATIAKVHTAKSTGAETVSVWGDGSARREFTYSRDLAAWLVTQIGRLETWPDVLNLGCGYDLSVAEYYEVAAEVVGFEGRLEFDTSKPSGVPRRLLDSSAARGLGWDAPTPIRDGLATTYSDFLAKSENPGR